MFIPTRSFINERYYQQLQRKNLLRLVLTYLLPMVVLAVYFAIQNPRSWT